MRFLDAKERYQSAQNKYKNADQALKIDKNLKTNFGDFVCFSSSVNNTLRDTLDWMYYCRGNRNTSKDLWYERLPYYFKEEPMDINGFVEEKSDEVITFQASEDGVKNIINESKHNKTKRPNINEIKRPIINHTNRSNLNPKHLNFSTRTNYHDTKTSTDFHEDDMLIIEDEIEINYIGLGRSILPKSGDN